MNHHSATTTFLLKLLSVLLFLQAQQGFANTLAEGSHRRDLARRSHILAPAYPYFDPEYDDKQNDLLALEALQEQFSQDMLKLQEAYFKPLEALHPDRLFRTLQTQNLRNKEALETELEQAGSDHSLQVKALDAYYGQLQGLLNQKDLKQAWKHYRAFRLQYDAFIILYSRKAGDNRYAPIFSKSMHSTELNPSATSWEEICRRMEGLGNVIERLRLEFQHKTRAQQILHNEYVGLSGSVQRLSDYLNGKGAFARR